MFRFCIFALLFFTSCINNTDNSDYYIEGKVVSVADGDSFTMLINNEKTKVRLHGIDCPEKRQAFGNKARQYTNSKIYKKNVRIDIKDKDKYQRLVAIVYYGNDNNLNEELLREGLAWHYKYYDSSKTFRDLEREAKSEKRGLWADKNPVEPWTFRRSKKAYIGFQF